jgi:hypothetical protein
MGVVMIIALTRFRCPLDRAMALTDLQEWVFVESERRSFRPKKCSSKNWARFVIGVAIEDLFVTCPVFP